MRDENDRVSLFVQLVKQAHDVPARGAVEIARRLIREKKRWPGHDRACNGNSLLLPSGKLRRLMVHAVRQLHFFKSLGDALPPLRRRHLLIDQRKLHVLRSRQPGQEIEILKNKPDLPVADVGQLIFAVILYGNAIKILLPFISRIQTADDIHHGGFAAS